MQAKSILWTLGRLAFSLAASHSLIAHIGPTRHWALFYAIFAGLAYVMAGPLFAWMRNTQPRVSHWGALSTAAVLWAVGFALTYAIPVPIAPEGRAGEKVDIEVSVLGPSPKGGLGAEVWFAIEADGARIPLDLVEHDAGWQTDDGMLRATQPGTSARWSGRASSLQVVLISHPWSGRARVVANGKSQVIDLYSAGPGNTTRSLHVIGDANPHLWMQFPDRTLKQRVVQLLDALLIALALYSLHLWLTSTPRTPSDSLAPLWRGSLRYALPAWTVSACLLMVFWPGVMSNDSIDQWHMAAAGITSDWHPTYHTLFIAAARKVWDSPAFIAMLQAGALGLSTGYLIAVLERATRTPAAVAHFASWCCALMPVVAFSSVTLWKDVPYAASVVAISAALVSLVVLGRPRLSHPLTFASALAILLVCMLFRHNGPPVAAATLLAVFALSKANRKAVAVLGLAAIGMTMVLKGPVTDAIGVPRSNVAFTLYSHHIAAHLESGAIPRTAESKALLRQIVKERETWPYSCGLIDVTIFNPAFDRNVAARHSNELRDTWLRMASEDPIAELKHLACVSSLVWLMDESGQSPLYEAGVSIRSSDDQLTWVEKGPEVQQASLAPRAAEYLGDWLQLTRQFNLLWRPAAWLYLLLFAVWVAVRRTGDWRIALIAAPILVHSMVLAVANVAQDPRYQLIVFIVALAAVPALLMSTPRLDRGSAEPANS